MTTPNATSPPGELAPFYNPNSGITLWFADKPDEMPHASPEGGTAWKGPYDITVTHGDGIPHLDYNCLNRDTDHYGCKIFFNSVTGDSTDVNIYMTEPIPGHNEHMISSLPHLMHPVKVFNHSNHK